MSTKVTTTGKGKMIRVFSGVVGMMVLLLSTVCVKAQLVNENFDGTTFPPTGWVVTNMGSGNNWARSTSTSSPTSLSGSVAHMRYSYNSNNAANTWAFTPAMTLSSSKQYIVQFYMAVAGASFPENLKVTLGSDQTSASQTTVLLDFPNFTATTQTLQSKIFTVSASGTYYAAFNCYSAADKFNLSVDNVIIREYGAPDAAPITFSSSAITNSSFNVEWVDNSTNEVGFNVYRSTDNVSFNLVGTVASSTIATTGTGYSLSQSGLAPGTTYYYRITASNLDGESSNLTGSESTLPAGVISAISSGLWSQTTTWDGGAIPTVGDNVTIPVGITVTIDINNAAANNITIDGSLEYQSTPAAALAARNITVSSTGSFNAGSGALTTHALSVSENIVNDGIFDLSTTAGVGLTFLDNGNSVISGSGSVTDVRTIIVNKGNANAVVELASSNFSVQGTVADGAPMAFLTLTKGIFKVSGSFTLSGRFFSPAAYTINANSGFWLNNSNVTVSGQAGNATLNGMLRISNGVFNAGLASGNRFNFAANSKVTIEGGFVNAAGGFGVSAATNAISYTQSGGEVTVCTVGYNSSSLASFDLGTALTSLINISGGKIICQLPNTSTTVGDFRNSGGVGISSVTGGTLQLGNASSGASRTFYIGSVIPNLVIDNSSNPNTGSFKTAVNYNLVSRNIEIKSGGTLSFLSNAIFLFAGSSIINNGTITNTGASARFITFEPNTNISYSGSGSATLQSLELQNDGNFTFNPGVTNNVVTSRIIIFSGSFVNANKITLGTGGSTASPIQIGNTTTPTGGGTFDVSPNFNLGTGGQTISYLRTTNSKVIGPEVNPSRQLVTLTYDDDNPSHTLTLSGGNLAATTVNLTNGIINTSAANILTVSGTTIASLVGGSSTAYINGPLQRNFPASASGTYPFPVGKAGYNPVDIVDPVTTGAVTIQAEAFDGDCGGSVGSTLTSISNTRYWGASVISGTGFTGSKVKLYDTRGSYEAIGGSATANGTYDVFGGFPATLANESIQTNNSAVVPGFLVMGVPASPEIASVSMSPSGNQCTNVARTITANVTPGGNAIVSVDLNYTVDGIPQTPISMSDLGGNVWEGIIPTVTPSYGVVEWSVTATDAGAMTASSPAESYQDDFFTPMTITPTANPATICSGAPSSLAAQAIVSAPGVIQLGTGQSTSLAGGITPFYNVYYSFRNQYLFRASELQAQGLLAGNITSLAFNITSAYTTYPFPSYTIKISHTNATAMTNNTYLSGSFTTVYGPTSVTSSPVGWKTFTFSAPFAWDGTSNIVVEICNSSSNWNSSATVATSTTSFNSTMGRYDDVSPADACTFTTWAYGGTASTTRPDVKFGGTTGVDYTSQYDWNWTPGNVAGNSISVNPGTTTTYYATATDPISGCSSAATPVTVTVNQLPETPIPAGSTQCGVGIPAAFIVSDFQSPNVSTNDFYWYDAPTGGNLLQTGGSTYTGSISQTTNFYVSESNGTCQSARVMVTATVNPPDAVTATVDNDEICLGGSANLGMNQSGSNQTYTFSWEASPETGSGITNPTPGASGTGALMVTPTAAGTYTYTITAVDGGCTTQSTIDVVVNALPVLYPATASPAAICAGNSSTLTALTDDIAPGVVQLGTGQSTSSDGGITPFYNLYYSFRNQYLFRASELQAAGLYAGNITSLAFNITSAYTTYPFPSYTIKISHTSATAMTDNTYLSGSFTTVYGPTSVTSSPVGWKTFTFSAPFAWDGTSNIVVEICNSSSNWDGSATVATSTTSFNSTMGRYNDVSPADACTYTAWTYGGTASTTRPDVKFGGQAMGTGPGSLSWNWMPGNLSGSSVSVSPAATEEYTVTGTDPVTGCSNSETVTVTVNQLPPAPTANDDSHCGLLAPNSTVTSNSGAATPVFNWYDAAIGGTLLQTGTSVSYTTPISVTTTWYVSEVSGDGCEGPRTAVTETVVDADQITATSTEVTICLGESFDLGVIQDNQNGNFYDYTWTASPESGSGISGSLIGNQQTITPAAAGTYTYQVEGEDVFAGCFASSSIDVLVNPAPYNVTANASSLQVCDLTTVDLTSSSSTGLYSGSFTLAEEGFETYPPAGWTFADESGSGGWRAAQTITPLLTHSGTNALAYLYNSNIDADAWAFMPSQYLVAGKTYTLTFWYQSTSIGGAYPEKMKVTVGTAANKGAQTNILWDDDDIIIEVFTQGTAQFTPSVSGDYYFAFNCYSDMDNDAFYVDDIKLTGPQEELATYQWSSNPAGFSSSDQNPTDVLVNGNTTFYVVATNSIGCASAPQSVTVNVNALPNAPIGTNSSQCGEQIPTASVSTGGGGGGFNWYDAQTGGNLLQAGGSTYGSVIASTTSLWVSESDGSCESARTEVIVTVTQPDPIELTPSQSVVCVNQQLSMSVANIAQTPQNTYTYSWSATPLAGSGLTGTETGTSVSPTPTVAGTYTYTVTGTDNGGQDVCTISSSVVITVNPLPEVTSAIATPPTSCASGSVLLSASSAPPAINGTIGTGTLVNTSSSYPAAFGTYWGNVRSQYLIRATELSSGGLTAGYIHSVSFTVIASGSSSTLQGYTVKIGNTPTATITQTIFDPTTTVFGPVNYSPSIGINQLNFSTPFYWDGVSNIFVEICFNNLTIGSSNWTTQATDMGYMSSSYVGNDNTTGTICANGVTNGSNARPNMVFKGLTGPDPSGNNTYTWNPGSLSGKDVVVNPSSSTTYSVFATDINTGCVSASVDVEVTVEALSATASATISTICVGSQSQLDVSVTGGGPFSYRWNDGNSNFSTDRSPVVSPTATTTYTVTVYDGCNNSIQSDVTVTVNALPSASIVETSPVTICEPDSYSLSASTNAANPSYAWYRGGVAIVGANASSYVASTSGAYTVVITDGLTGCISAPSVPFILTVNDQPSEIIITPSVVNMCENNPQQLTASGGQVLTPGTGVATGTTPTTIQNTLQWNPFSRYYEGSRKQYLIRANELTAMGLTAGGTINSVSFNVTSNTSSGDVTNRNFNVKVGATALNTLASGYATGTTSIFSTAAYVPVVGVNTFPIVTPFVWDGVSNFVVEICTDNNPDGSCSSGSPLCWSSAGMVVSSATSLAGSTRYNYADYISGVRDMCSGTNGTEYNLATRPVITLGITKVAQAAITWSPVTGLFTDAAATVAYNGEATTSVYTSPSAGNYTYTASSLSEFGCPGASANVEVNVTPALDVSAEITGPTNSGAHVGNGSPLATYSITASNYSTIVWNLPNGALNVSGQGTTSISFNYATNYTGSISVDVTGISPCDPITRTLNITCDAPAAPVISGQVNVCTYVGTNVELTYTAAPDANATSYSWVVPPTNVTVVNGQGTGELTITLGAGFTAQANKQLRVRAHNSCGTSEMSIFYMLAQMPGSLGEISGPMDACGLIDGQTQVVYSVAEVDQAEQYNWVVPAGVTIINGQGTTSITVEFDNAFATSAISVTAQNGCGVSNTRSITISRTVPSIPSLISGPNNPCLYMPSVGYPSGQIATYSVAQVGGNTYTWTVPTGANIESGQGTNSITVSFSGSYNGGGISVTASTGCGTSGSRSIALSNRMPSAPSGIDIDIVSEDCPNRVYTYSLSSMPMQATSVVWTVPAGATIVDGQGTTSITVEYSGMSIAGNITAVGNNGCGNSGIRSLKVKFPECSQGERGESLPITKVTPVEVIEGGLDVSIFPNPSVHSFKLVAKSTDKFNKIQVRLVDNLGRTYKVMSMMPGETLTLGNELKAGSYFVEVVQGKNKASKRIIKL
ncbi:MAG: T9SS type A sorting domain-containing protein [Ferruginibacter sp.]|nr:T9SS type A sorting domain-containing protein [Ferruginibacter sp.]